MQVFDFSNGAKGRLLAEVGLITHANGYPVVTDPVTGKKQYLVPVDTTFMGKNSRTTVAVGAGRFDTKYTPEMFGVDAILFCQGQMFCGFGYQDPGEWTWFIVGTDEWVATALSNGFFKD
jgi:hypothetical protein